MTNQIYNTQVISIGGEVIHLASYEDIRTYEIDLDGTCNFTRENYLSLIMNNFGYNGMPNIDWLHTDPPEPIENVDKSNQLQIPQLQSPGLMITDKSSLFDVFTCVYLWGRGVLETGVILDRANSWLWPDNKEISFCLQNNIKIERPFKYTQRLYWPKTDVLSRRLLNLRPNIDNEYYENCIAKFNQYTAMMPVEEPRVLFLACILSPDLVLATIKKSEMKAASIVNKKYKYPTLRPDYETAIEFYVIFSQELNKFNTTYKEHGPSAFIAHTKKEVVKVLEPDNSVGVSVNSTAIDTNTDRLAQLDTIDEKRAYVDNTELNAKTVAFIFKYLDKASIPEYLIRVEQGKNGDDTIVSTFNPQYTKFLKRVYCIFESIANNHNYWLKDDTKWIFSKPCYNSGNIFGLYNRSLGLFLLAYSDMTYSLEEPKSVIQIYRDKYDKDILFDMNEMGQSLATKASTPSVVLDSDVQQTDAIRYENNNTEGAANRQ